MALDEKYTAEDVEELAVQARGALLTRIAAVAAGTNSALTLQRLAEAYAYAAAPDNAHGAIS